MKWIIFVLLMVACMLLVMLMCYALMVMAHEADERSEEMYKEWKEKDDGKAV